MTSRLRRLRCLDQLDERARRHTDRVAAAGNLHPRNPVVVDVDDISGQNDGIADLGGVGVSFLSHSEYLAQEKQVARDQQQTMEAA